MFGSPTVRVLPRKKSQPHKHVAQGVIRLLFLFDSTMSCLSFTAGQMDLSGQAKFANYLFIKVLPPKGAAKFVYVNISLYKTGLHLSRFLKK